MGLLKHTQFLCWSCLILLLPIHLNAQSKAPGLFPQGSPHSTSLPLQMLDIRTDVFGKWALTEVEMTFRGDSSTQFPSDFLFPLLAGEELLSLELASRTTPSAMDSLGPQWQALQQLGAKQSFPSPHGPHAFPLHESWLSHAGQELIRMGPLPSASDLRITVQLKHELEHRDGDYVLDLPGRFHQPADSFRLRLLVHDQIYKPIAKAPKLGQIRFKRHLQHYRAVVRRLRHTADDRITLFLPIGYGLPVQWFGAQGDSTRFMLHLPTDLGARKGKKPRTLHLLWDASLPGGARDTDRELRLLDKLFASLGEVEVLASSFDRGIRETKSFEVIGGNWGDLRSFLEDCPMDGARDFSKALQGLPETDLTLLFTDAPTAPKIFPTFPENTFLIHHGKRPGANAAHLWGLPEHCLVNIDRNKLRHTFDRIQSSPLEITRIKYKAKHLSQIHVKPGVEVDGGITFSGMLKSRSAPLELTFGHHGKAAEKVKVKLHPSDEQLDFRIDALAQSADSFPRIFPQRLVDFHLHGGAAPAAWQPWLETLAAWEIAQKQKEGSELAERKAWNKEIFEEDWEMMRENWAGRYNPEAKLPEPIYIAPTEAPEPSGFGLWDALTAGRYWVPQLVLAGDTLYEKGLPERLHGEIRSVRWLQGGALVARFGPQARSGVLWVELPDGPRYDPELLRQIPEWQAEAPYLKNRYGALSKDYDTYLANLPEWQSHPSFFLDWADQFILQGSPELAIRALSNFEATEQAEAEILRAAAHRLLAWGGSDLAVGFLEQVVAQQGEDPIARRDLALALEGVGRVEEALDQLQYALVQDAKALDARLPGIRSVLLRELNHLCVLHGLSPDSALVPEGFPSPMPMDLRITCDWNRSDTDLDLIVTGPDSLRCDYDRPVTPNGGILAGDVTDGFGPEEFTLRNAQKGIYTIEVEYEDNPERRISGPTFVLVTIYTDYGMAGEAKKTIPLRLSGQSGTVEAARVLVE